MNSSNFTNDGGTEHQPTFVEFVKFVVRNISMRMFFNHEQFEFHE